MLEEWAAFKEAAGVEGNITKRHIWGRTALAQKRLEQQDLATQADRGDILGVTLGLPGQAASRAEGERALPRLRF
eukprot:9664777-Alexandrium_andersonii.AAC.1